MYIYIYIRIYSSVLHDGSGAGGREADERGFAADLSTARGFAANKRFIRARRADNQKDPTLKKLPSSQAQNPGVDTI